MSEGGTKREVRREIQKDLIAKLKTISPKPGDVFVIEVAADYFADEERLEAAQMFAQDVLKSTGRDVFIVVEGYKLTAVPDPRPVEKQSIVTPPPGIMLPTGVKLPE